MQGGGAKVRVVFEKAQAWLIGKWMKNMTFALQDITQDQVSISRDQAEAIINGLLDETSDATQVTKKTMSEMIQMDRSSTVLYKEKHVNLQQLSN